MTMYGDNFQPSWFCRGRVNVLPNELPDLRSHQVIETSFPTSVMEKHALLLKVSNFDHTFEKKRPAIFREDAR